jgi:hypothetical protein
MLLIERLSYDQRMTLGFACENIGKVVSTLATGHGTLNERIGHAFH